MYIVREESYEASKPESPKNTQHCTKHICLLMVSIFSEVAMKMTIWFLIGIALHILSRSAACSYIAEASFPKAVAI